MLVLLDLYFTLLYTIYYHYIYALLISHFLYSVSMFRSLVISWVLNSAWNGVSSNIYLLHPSAKGKYLKWVSLYLSLIIGDFFFLAVICINFSYCTFLETYKL